MTDIHNEAKTLWRAMPKKQRKAIKAQDKAGATVEWRGAEFMQWELVTDGTRYDNLAYRIRPGTEKDLTPAPDLTAIDKPLGLLDPATAAALRAHGRPYQMFDISGWVDRPNPVWSPACTYRVKPQTALPKLVVDWPRMPKWARFAARDYNGTVWCFSQDPEVGALSWIASAPLLRIDELPGIILDTGACDWTASLIERPEGEVK